MLFLLSLWWLLIPNPLLLLRLKIFPLFFSFSIFLLINCYSWLSKNKFLYVWEKICMIFMGMFMCAYKYVFWSVCGAVWFTNWIWNCSVFCFTSKRSPIIATFWNYCDVCFVYVYFFSYKFLQLKCGTCGEVSQKETCVTLGETVALPVGKGTTNLIQKVISLSHSTAPASN